jgi:hypothetical protein
MKQILQHSLVAEARVYGLSYAERIRTPEGVSIEWTVMLKVT